MEKIKNLLYENKMKSRYHLFGDKISEKVFDNVMRGLEVWDGWDCFVIIRRTIREEARS